VARLSTRELRAIHDVDLEEFLERLGLLGSIKEGKVTCVQCGSVVTLDNFGAAFPESGRIRVVCDKLECLRPFLRAEVEG